MPWLHGVEVDYLIKLFRSTLQSIKEEAGRILSRWYLLPSLRCMPGNMEYVICCNSSTWLRFAICLLSLGSSVAKSQAPQSTTSADSTFTWNTIWDDTSTAEPTVSRAAKFDGVVDAEEKSHDDAQRVREAHWIINIGRCYFIKYVPV